MDHVFLTVCLLFSCLNILKETNSALPPRMIFTEKETSMKRLPLPEHHAPVRIILEEGPDMVTVVGQKHLISYKFQNPLKTPVKRRVLWNPECSDNGHSSKDCNYNITVVHKMKEANQLFVCGTNGRETACCNMTLSGLSPTCTPSEKMERIKFIVKEGEPSVFVESEKSADLYMTDSGAQEYVGIYKFGEKRVGPASHNKEQHYVGLMLSRQEKDPSQDKVYGFYKEKDRGTGLNSGMWLPFVTQVCMADMGGPKNTLQFTWTTQMNARLFCGDPDSKQYFSELVDVATVEADHWQDTMVYALFRNEWGMSAVCVYSIGDINHIFTTSPFKGDNTDSHGSRPRECVTDSTKIPPDVLKMIEKTLEMEQWVRPVNNSGPLLLNHHRYTHIYVDTSQHKRNSNHPLLFLSLQHGGIHKVTKSESQSFVIAEYQPFAHKAHILSILLQPHSRKLYVNSGLELVQLDVANCAQYGDSCEECVLARDPYCGWNGKHCSLQTRDTRQDVAHGNHSICTSPSNPGKVLSHSSGAYADQDVDSIILPPQSKYFLQCPVSSHHAQYTWHLPNSSTACSPREQQCLLLIPSMGPKEVGTYTCVSEEMGYSRVLTQYQLLLENGAAAGHSMSPLVWVCLTAVMLVLLSK